VSIEDALIELERCRSCCREDVLDAAVAMINEGVDAAT
jgi:hypothetical protein